MSRRISFETCLLPTFEAKHYAVRERPLDRRDPEVADLRALHPEDYCGNCGAYNYKCDCPCDEDTPDLERDLGRAEYEEDR